jgi:hypothetical protein
MQTGSGNFQSTKLITQINDREVSIVEVLNDMVVFVVGFTF